MKHFLQFCLSVFVVLLCGCGDGGGGDDDYTEPSPGVPETVAVTGITLSETSIVMNIGGSRTLTATVSPSNATDKTVTWSSSRASVASVSSSGEVTALSAGTATITARAGGKTATCAVTVKIQSGVGAGINGWGSGEEFSGSVN